MRAALALVLALLAGSSAIAGECLIIFDCVHDRLSIDGKVYPLTCGPQTGQGLKGGVIGPAVFKAEGPWRPGLVAPGTPMIDTIERVCYDCFIHAGYGRNGCLGTSSAAFNKIARDCLSSQFRIEPRR